MKLHVFLSLLLATAACSASTSSPGGSNDSGALADSSSSGGGEDAGDSSSSGGGGDGAASDGAGGDTWDNWAQGFAMKYCVECHNASDPTGRDFRTKAIVVANKLPMRCGVCNTQQPSWNCPPSPAPQAQQFPIDDTMGTNPKPTSAERDRIVAWITAGCP